MITVPAGFAVERIATVGGARELAMSRSGDLYIGTLGSEVYIISHAENGKPDAPRIFVRLNDHPAAGVAIGTNALFVGTEFGVYRVPLASRKPVKIASVRTSGERSDHHTTSVAWDGNNLFASIGSSCDACRPELDTTRATIQRIDLANGKRTPAARNIRNAIALTIDRETGALWVGVAGVDDLPTYHPYEIFDDVTSHPGPVDYGWPSCYDNRQHAPQWPGDCSRVAISRVIFPAYETPIGAIFYPVHQSGAHAFPARFRGGAFVTLHGSWHGPAQGLSGYMPPRIVFVPMHGDEPVHAVDWNDPASQWQTFVSGFQEGGSSVRIARPTGIAVGPDGSLFFADDQSGGIFRIRPR